jgi:hypothetical protein
MDEAGNLGLMPVEDRDWTVAAGPTGGEVGYLSPIGNIRSGACFVILDHLSKRHAKGYNYEFRISSGKPPSNSSLKLIPQGSNILNHLSPFSDPRTKSTPYAKYLPF